MWSGIMYTDRVRKLASEIAGKTDFVRINDLKAQEIAAKIEPKASSSHGVSPGAPDDRAFLYSLIANSVNYCYWYGWHSIRPNGACSRAMHDNLKASFEEFWPDDVEKIETLDAHRIINEFVARLTRQQFPWAEERIGHLGDIKKHMDYVLSLCYDMPRDVNEAIGEIIVFSTYCSDMFLKRAQLFCAMIQRECNYFENIRELTVPADYHIPKMLRHYGCLEYAAPLAKSVDCGVLIPKGSAEEVSIRACSIVCCDRIAEMAGVSAAEVDGHLFFNREECDDPFHLTITTDY
jgi:hypothetical protein